VPSSFYRGSESLERGAHFCLSCAWLPSAAFEKRGGGAPKHADKERDQRTPGTLSIQSPKPCLSAAITLFPADHGFVPGMTGILIGDYGCYQG